MAKVAKEAAKVKSVLSANSDSSVNVSSIVSIESNAHPSRVPTHAHLVLRPQIESFFDDRDYRSRFTREQLETSAGSIINEKKYEKPIWDALKMANLTVVSRILVYFLIKASG